MRLSNLLELATKFLNSSEVEEQLRTLDSYTDQFDQVFPNGEFSNSDLALNDTQTVQELKQLDSLHGQVLELAQKLQVQTQQQLRLLHFKGKGIMAYADNYPKKISLSKGKKG